MAFFRGYPFELMQFLENNCVKLINCYEGMRNVRDKFKTHKIAQELNINQPKTIYNKFSNYGFLSSYLGNPFVMKDNIGSRGAHNYLITNEKQLLEILEEQKDKDFIYQEYIKNSCGKDVRLYIVGNEVIGCILRQSLNGDFKANISLGGIGIKYQVPDNIKEISLKLAKKMGLEICSVDYLIDEDKYIFCEANGNASFSAFINNGYKMQDIFMNYISKKYRDFTNYWARLKDKAMLSEDYIVEIKTQK